MKRRAPSAPDLFGFKAIASPRQVERVQLVDLELRRLAERDTDKAFCVQASAISEPVWLPRQLTELDGAVFTFPRWLAVDKGLL